MTRHLVLAALVSLSTAACAERPGSDPAALGATDPGACHPPPPEALAACASASAGAACSFEHAGHTATGTCAAGPSADAPLACKPAQPPPPPPEALAACDGAAAGDPCDLDRHEGRCTATPAGLACAPPCPPPPQ